MEKLNFDTDAGHDIKHMTGTRKEKRIKIDQYSGDIEDLVSRWTDEVMNELQIESRKQALEVIRLTLFRSDDIKKCLNAVLHHDVVIEDSEQGFAEKILS
ncbi:MAG: hypothetical protein KC649_00330 [Candidatus Omnitrophica bacterium]|nr:hypothetical protein [Candidatus Omnitrophota bacterium]